MNVETHRYTGSAVNFLVCYTGGSFFSQVLTLCFWLGAIFASWKILLWFGKDIVDKPQLVPRSKPKAA
jgi:hypothetical protein